MSSYLVSAEQYVVAMEVIQELTRPAHALSYFHETPFSHGLSGVQVIRLAYALNRRAVAYRYRGDWQGDRLAVKKGQAAMLKEAAEPSFCGGMILDVTDKPYLAWGELKQLTRLSSFLSCVLYQCSEEPVNQSPLFDIVVAYHHAVDSCIVSAQGGHDPIEWGDIFTM